MCVYIYIYIYREREREIWIYTYTHIHIYTYCDSNPCYRLYDRQVVARFVRLNYVLVSKRLITWEEFGLPESVLPEFVGEPG